MERDSGAASAEVDGETDTTELPDDAAPNAPEESAMSHDSEYDDFLGVPDSMNMTVNENGEPISIEEGNADTCDRETRRALPFSSVHNADVKFNSQNRNIFIPGEDIHARIVDIERSVTTHPLNPNLYTIEFTHGPFTWTIKKRYKHIQYLHNQLKIYRASLNIPFPTKSHREKRNSFKSMASENKYNKEKKRRRGALPRFPNRPDVLVPHEYLNHRMVALGEYLDTLLKIEIYKQHPETANFLEVSHLSFIGDLGEKGKEGMVKKRTGSHAKTGCNFCGLFEGMCCIRCSHFCTSICGKWHQRHLIVKDTFVAYISPKDGRIKSVILFDQRFEVSSGIYSTGLRNGLQVVNLSRHIVIKCWTRRKAKEWLEHIQQLMHGEGRQFIQANPHKSFVPYRCPVPACWFVDGSSYMSAVADALESATEEIFIADWWLSPEIYMKRPAIHGDYWRLDNILHRKAVSGVKVFVMIYKEVELALGINSFYSKQRLVEKCPENIKVLRHPDHARVGVFLWAHHEKIVVVDQSIAFLGGIDLCYGRWDNNEHRLTDIGSTHLSSIYIPSKGKIVNTSSKRISTRIAENHVLLPLAIATNTIAMATTKCIPILPMVCKTQKKPQTPTIDLNDPMFISPPQGMENVKCNTPDSHRKNLFDMAINTVDKVKKNVKMKRKEWINMVYNPHEASSDDENVVDNASAMTPLDAEDTQQSLEDQDEVDDVAGYGAKLWLGKDYVNFIVKDFDNLESPYQDLVDRSTTPRMPWHDVGLMVQGASARDVARHYIQRWNAIKMEKAKLNATYPFLLPKSYKDCANFVPRLEIGHMHNVKCQVLRSVSSWSAGFLEPDTVEQSIHEAYIHAITKAERFIYIENQFFITLSTFDNSVVKNRIGETLLKRIIRAHREGTVFRVFVMMPLLPGFEGEVGGPTGSALRAITHWNYASISRGKDSICNQLIEAGIDDPSEYITFHGLRTHAVLNGTMVTELIYVHSKLMIVDDKTVICGSANINDRSMIATRDSEIAVIIHDTEFYESRQNDMSFTSGKFAGSLRKHLFREHLGLLWSGEDISVEDVVKKSFYHDIWRARSKVNTEIFEDIFNCVPTNKIVNFQMLKQYQNETPLCFINPDLAQQMIKNVKGHLVDMPLNFLCNESLKPAAGTVEGIMPTSLWT